jgi:hypothetical protein
MGVLPKYVQQPPEATDMAILNSHPCVEWWKAFAGFVDALPQYKNHQSEHNLQQLADRSY